MREVAGMFAAVFIIYIIGASIVNIIRASKQSGGKKINQSVSELESRITQLEEELDDARGRIEVLERIVTDEKHQLSRDIDSLKED